MNAEALKLDRGRAAFLLVDLQEKLAKAMPPDGLARVERNVLALVEGAKALGVPLLVTEQYPQGIGATLPAIRAALPEGVTPIEKVEFSCLSSPAVADALARLGRRQIVVAGMEAHICVYQTARDLAAAGYQVFVPYDAVLSRVDDNRRVGLDLAARAGAVPTTTESVLFDLLGRAGTPEFKAVSRLVR